MRARSVPESSALNAKLAESWYRPAPSQTVTPPAGRPPCRFIARMASRARSSVAKGRDCVPERNRCRSALHRTQRQPRPRRTSQGSGDNASAAWYPLSFPLQALLRICRRRRHGVWMIADQLLQILDPRFQLRVLAPEGGVRQVIHYDVRIDAVAFDEPLTFRSVHAHFGSGRDALVRQGISHRKPDLAAPGACTNHLSQA